MVVHDFQNLRLVQPRHGLGFFIVVHQNHPLAAGAQQVEAGQRAHHPFVLVQDGISPETALQHGVLHVVDIVVQVETDQSLAVADVRDGQSVADQAHGLIGVDGGGDDAGAGFGLQQLLGHLRLTDDDTADLQLQGPADHLRLVTADDNAVLVGEHEIFPAGGQGDDHLAGDDILQLTAFVEYLALQNRQQIEHGDLPHAGVSDRGHVVVGYIPGGEHAVQCAVLIGHGEDGDLFALHGLPTPADGGGGGQSGGDVIIQVPDLGADVADELGRLESEAVQYELGLVADLTQPGGLVLPLAQGIFQRGVSHGGDDGVGVRVSVSGDIYGVHRETLLWGNCAQYSIIIQP